MTYHYGVNIANFTGCSETAWVALTLYWNQLVQVKKNERSLEEAFDRRAVH